MAISTPPDEAIMLFFDGLNGHEIASPAFGGLAMLLLSVIASTA